MTQSLEDTRIALALAALAEVTDPDDVGALIGTEQPQPGVVDLHFACTLPAYIGWHWTVSTSDLPDVEPTVLEVELLPGEGSLLAPPWVPWAERLAEWRRQHPDEQPADGETALEDDEDEADGDEDDLDVDELEDDVDDDLLEGADVDGEDVQADEDDGSDEDSDEDDGSDDVSDADDDEDEPDVTGSGRGG